MNIGNNENTSDSNSNKRYGSKSWEIYNECIKPTFFNNLLDSHDFFNVNDNNGENIEKEIVYLSKKQELNNKILGLYTESFVNLRHASLINGWNYNRNEILRDWKNKLEYYYVVNYHFMFNLKKKESYYIWILIIISSISSFMTFISFDDNTIFSHVIKLCSNILSIITTLIAAYINKEKFVDKIKDIDRYIMKIGKINTELSNIICLKPWNRLSYESFIDKYKEDILTLFSNPPPISPNNFKRTVYKLTTNYPELINNTYPWYIIDKIGNVEYYKMTTWGHDIIKSYNKNKCFSYKYCCFKKTNLIDNKFMNYKKYNEILLHTKQIEKIKKDNGKYNDIINKNKIKKNISNLKNNDINCLKEIIIDNNIINNELNKGIIEDELNKEIIEDVLYNIIDKIEKI
jgi:hypothetical protein